MMGDYGILFFVIGFIYLFLFAGLGAWLAEKKGYSSGGWFLICLLTGPAGLIALVGAPNRGIESLLDEIKQQLATKSTDNNTSGNPSP